MATGEGKWPEGGAVVGKVWMAVKRSRDRYESVEARHPVVTESLRRLLHGAEEVEERHKNRSAPVLYLLDELRFEWQLL